MFRKIKLFVFVIFVASVVSGFCVHDDVFAFSTSISTSGAVTVNVSASGDGASVGTDNVVVNSTCPAGYTLSIGGPSDSTLYKGGNSNATSIAPSNGTSANPLPIVGDDGNNNSYVGTWGYTTAENADYNSNFIGLTSTANTLIAKNSASANGGDTIPVHYGVSVDMSQDSGSYYMANSGTVTYYLVNSILCTQAKVVYDDNGANSTTTMSVTHDNVIIGDDVTLYASNYKRAGYGFAGWSAEQIDPDAANAATLINEAATSGKIYGPNETVTTDVQFFSNGTMVNNELIVTMYAVWVKPATGATLQDFICPLNQQMPIGSIVALTDVRDNDVYAVAKLADNNCWIIENLRLDYNASHNSDGTLAQGYGVSSTYGNFSGLAQPETANFSNSAATANSLYYSGTQSGTASIDVGTTNYPAYRIPRYNNENTSSTVSDMTAADQNVYSYGNYYNWPAAAANTASFVDNLPTTVSTSICPSGWKLPEGGNGVGFSALDVQLGGTGVTNATTEDGVAMSKAWRAFPNNFLYAGDFSDSLAEDRGSWGSYWSATTSSTTAYAAARLRVREEVLSPAAGESYAGSTIFGFSVRCQKDSSRVIVYNDNGANSTTTMSVRHTGVVEDDEISLYASNYKRAGYGFAGWSTEQIDPDAANAATLINNAILDGKVYGPNETIIADGDFLSNGVLVNGVTTVYLYAVWVKPNTGATFQNFTCPSNQQMPVGSVIALTDIRDNDVYAVAKLANGDCWMIENLRLDYDANITTSNTQSNNGSFGGVFAGLPQPEVDVFQRDITTANSLYYIGTQSGTASIDIGTDNEPGNRIPRYSNVNTASTVSDMTAADQNIYSYGNYYNWPAAAADTNAYESYPDGGYKVSTSICPSGWELPHSDSYSFLDYKIGGTGSISETNTVPNGETMSRSWRSYPNNFLYSGDYHRGNVLGDRGIEGLYWSSVSGHRDPEKHSINARRLRFASYIVSPAHGSSKTIMSGDSTALADHGNTAYAYSVRCLRRDNYTTYTVSFNANGGSGAMSDQNVYSDQGVSFNKNEFTAPAKFSSYQDASGTTIPGGSHIYWVFDGWNTEIDGSGYSYTDGGIADDQLLAALEENNGHLTLYAQWKGIEVMIVNYESNGFAFSDGTTENTMVYYNSCGPRYVSTPRYSHTSNINDDGTRIGNYGYSNNLATKDVVTVPGADSLHVTINYSTENNYDMLYVFEGEYTGSVTRNMSAGQLAKYMGGNGTISTVTIDIPGDTATFAFYSDSQTVYFGYYATVVGYYDDEPASYDHATQVCVRELLEGEYKTPVVDDHHVYTGWNESSSSTSATYTSAASVLEDLPGNNGETKTLYAVNREAWVMTFINNATSATQSKKVIKGQSTTVSPSSTWSRTNYKLMGWDTNSAGTNVVYSKGQSITPTADMTFYTVWSPTYTIEYNINTTDTNATGTMGTHTSIAEGDSVTLYASNFSRTNYGFAGWSFSSNAQPGGSATIYGPNETITAPAAPSPGGTVTLYAVWVASAGNLQSWSGCSSLSVGRVTALKDTRDNQVYAVAKLADGKCWMIENLRLDSTATNFTESRSQGFGKSTTYGNFSGLATAETSLFSNSSSANSLYYSGTQSGTASVDIGTTDSPGARMPRYNNNNTSSRASNATGSGNTYSYGNYYTWAAAMANTIFYDSADAQDANGKTSETVNTSICPTGWRLPYGNNADNGNTAGGFYYLNYKLNGDSNVTNSTASTKLRAYPNNFVYSGYYSSSSASSRGSSGYYWTSTANSATYSYRLYFTSSSVNPGTSNNYKYYGQAVRCVRN